MKRYAYVILSGVVLISCKGHYISDFSMGKLDLPAVDRMISKSIVIKQDTPARKDFYYESDYLIKEEGITTQILKDSAGRIVGILQRRDSIRIFVSEYYPNGQEKGDVPLNSGGKISGVATYYYANGKVRIVGRLQDGIHVGEWKYYNEDGSLSRTSPSP